METVPLKIHESVKEDFKTELEEAELKLKFYKEFVKWIANEIDTVQETEAIKAKIKTLLAKEDKLEKIKDNRPITRHPLEGVGNLLRENLILIKKRLKRKPRGGQLFQEQLSSSNQL